MKKAYTARFKAQVVLELLKETKTISQIAADYEVHPNALRAWRDQAVKELPVVFEKRDSLVDAQAAHARQLEELYAEIGRLTRHVTFLKKGCRPEYAERRALLDHATGALPLTSQADLLSMSRRSLYYQPLLPPPEEVALKHRIDELYSAHPFYRSRKLTVLLEPDFAPIKASGFSAICAKWGLRAFARDRT